MPAKQIVVTLTSFPPRFSNLPRKRASIGRQTVRPDRVELHLPKDLSPLSGAAPDPAAFARVGRGGRGRR